MVLHGRVRVDTGLVKLVVTTEVIHNGSMMLVCGYKDFYEHYYVAICIKGR